jgi:hypothetical protein
LRTSTVGKGRGAWQEEARGGQLQLRRSHTDRPGTRPARPCMRAPEGGGKAAHSYYLNGTKRVAAVVGPSGVALAGPMVLQSQEPPGARPLRSAAAAQHTRSAAAVAAAAPHCARHLHGTRTPCAVLSGRPAPAFEPDPTWPARAFLMELYAAQHARWAARGAFAATLAELGLGPPANVTAVADVRIQATEVGVRAGGPLRARGGAVVWAWLARVCQRRLLINMMGLAVSGLGMAPSAFLASHAEDMLLTPDCRFPAGPGCGMAHCCWPDGAGVASPASMSTSAPACTLLPCPRLSPHPPHSTLRCRSWRLPRCRRHPARAAPPAPAPRRAPSAAAGPLWTAWRASTSRRRGGWTSCGRGAMAHWATALLRAAADGAEPLPSPTGQRAALGTRWCQPMLLGLCLAHTCAWGYSTAPTHLLLPRVGVRRTTTALTSRCPVPTTSNIPWPLRVYISLWAGPV